MLPTMAWWVWLLRDLLLGLTMLPLVQAALRAREDSAPGPGIIVLMASAGWLSGLARTAVGALLAGLLFARPLQVFRAGYGLPPGAVAQAFSHDRVTRAAGSEFPGVTLWRVQGSSLPELVGYDEARRAVLRRDALVRRAHRSGRFTSDSIGRFASEAYACDALATVGPAVPPSLRGGVLVFWCQRLDAGSPVRMELRVGP